MERVQKHEQISRRWGKQDGSPWIKIAVWGIGAFLAVMLLASLGVTVIAYTRRDPASFAALGRICPYVASVVAGAVGGRKLTDRPWLGGLFVGACSSLLLWLLSAGIESEASALSRLLSYLSVAASAPLGALLPGVWQKPVRKHRRKRRYG